MSTAQTPLCVTQKAVKALVNAGENEPHGVTITAHWITTLLESLCTIILATCVTRLGGTFASYGLYTANCFGLRHFLGLPTKSERDQQDVHMGDYTLPAGKSMTFQYRIVLHSGDTDKANVAAGYDAYAKPFEAEIVWK